MGENPGRREQNRIVVVQITEIDFKCFFIWFFRIVKNKMKSIASKVKNPAIKPFSLTGNEAYLHLLIEEVILVEVFKRQVVNLKNNMEKFFVAENGI